MALRVPQVSVEVANQPASANIRVAQVTLEVAILPAPLSLWCGNPPSALIGEPYSFQIPASGGWGSYTFAITAGSLPPGLSLNTSTGVISGTPTGVGFTCASIIHFDEATHNDQGAAMVNFWESGLARGIGELISMMIRLGGMIIWARGNGKCDIKVWGPDHRRNVTPQLLQTMGVPATLSPTPGLSYFATLDLSQVENFTIQIGTSSVDAWVEISMLQPLWKPDLANR
jgi:hypothetical protein